MAKTLPISEVKTRLPELVSGIEEREEEIVVTRNGKPAAVLVNYDEYERLKGSLEVLSDPDLMKQILRSKTFMQRKAKHVFRGRFWRTSSGPEAAKTVMTVYRPDIPPHVAQLIRHFLPELKRSVKQAIRSLSSNPFSSEPLLRELTGLWKYKVRRFRLIYEVDRKAGSFGYLR
jgi:prevent-host-death family protein